MAANFLESSNIITSHSSLHFQRWCFFVLSMKIFLHVPAQCAQPTRTIEQQNNRTTEPQNNRTTDNNQTNHQSKQKHGTGRKQQQGMIRTTKEFTAQHTGTTGPVVFGHFMFRIATTSTGVGGSTVPGHKILSQCFHFRHHLFPMFAVMNRHHFDRTYSQSRQMQRFVHHTTRPASQIPQAQQIVLGRRTGHT